MKRKLLFLLLPMFVFLSCNFESTTTIQKIEFYRGWEQGEGNMKYLGSTNDQNFAIQYRDFDMAIYTEEPLKIININITSDEGFNLNQEFDTNDYEVMRRRYKAFGYYVIHFQISSYEEIKADYNLVVSGTTEKNRKYTFTYKGKVDIPDIRSF